MSDPCDDIDALRQLMEKIEKPETYEAYQIDVTTVLCSVPRVLTELEALRASRGRMVDSVLDAASAYIKDQYGIGALSHPTDRQSVLAALQPAEDCGEVKT